MISFSAGLRRLPFPGGYDQGATPVPISNRSVKPFCADGTAWAVPLGRDGRIGHRRAFSFFAAILTLREKFPVAFFKRYNEAAISLSLQDQTNLLKSNTVPSF